MRVILYSSRPNKIIIWLQYQWRRLQGSDKAAPEFKQPFVSSVQKLESVYSAVGGYILNYMVESWYFAKNNIQCSLLNFHSNTFISFINIGQFSLWCHFARVKISWYILTYLLKCNLVTIHRLNFQHSLPEMDYHSQPVTKLFTLMEGKGNRLRSTHLHRTR